MATRLVLNEIPQFIPGAKPVTNVLPVKTEIVNSVEPSVVMGDGYKHTKDLTAVAGKTYYYRQVQNDGSLKYIEDKTINTGDKLVSLFCFEKCDTETYSNVKRSVVYDVYTEGWWVESRKGGACPKEDVNVNDSVMPVLVEHPIEIIKTITDTIGDNTFVSRWHAVGFWEQRKELTYIPLCDRIGSNTNQFKASDRIFR